MGTYFHGNSEIQGDGLQTLILMNPSYVNYADAQPPPPPGNFVFLNSAAAGNSINPQNFSHAPPNQTQQFVGIPLSADPHHPSIHHHQHEISAVHGFIPRVPYNIYSSSIDHTTAAREPPRSQQGLSLSLSGGGGDEVRVSGGSPSSASGISNGVNGVQSVLLSSKYLKAAQELLDEVVNVGKGLKSESGKGVLTNGKSKASGESAAAAGEGASGGEPSGKRGGGELTPAERQEIQMKKAKLVNMLDEVEQRYRQYHHQMQIVISWFEQAAGIGSARTYTALALQTISRQFRCLKDAIAGQIREASNNLGEENCFGGGKTEGSSRLKFVDHQIRQQRALQQLGMLQPNAWRPQRGLPERSVSVLRAWLFEHFLHPYPKDSDKIMLAKQTGLTRSQVSNWFINARVRLWKPMVEEMYVEETKEQEQNESEGKTSEGRNNEDSLPKSDSQKSPATENQNRSFKSKQDNPTNQNTPPISVSTASTSPTGISIRNQPGFTLIGSPVMEGFGQGSPKKQKSTEILQSPNSFSPRQVNVKPGETNTEQFSMRFGDERQRRDGGFTLMGAPTNFIEGFGSYSISEISRFGAEQFPYSGNGVSLTLGLPHCENLSMSGTHQTFLPNQTVEMGEENEFGTINTPTSSHSTSVYENINIQNRKRFAAQLLPDFVT
ncbi:BEL1-like homeodomain protein 1 [Actinidia eriantha]|uniref:BEL1-like homeodomain protein 1 n=1 Tax=Actinidia eriantha TaxID=165200 RepID=UPI00258AFB88|nr:BEL1-like homeodomain protein 1 [Actinidia eriantha]XP_057498952.1 BEL1-like homeodomain protein 1 [Actinidia eriantha]XP_057498953.1 BEL1-like homeodomain protein 1 [Actinidia eriantha]XP_057498954.1 BEL1-like homeodomain protein 1 [Actinidia eriantha]XP_057498955.1 BEL1-like homeodomain protein 1 [Actinidia eriantha]XP_057498956.1 BEL1-like homeodomain protein 1 [Actinidia eriantha]XP_057498957.1 BEL1-like homeodomain protein 1 [Actinidia eriantha]